ncbi:hypothetical protein ACOI1C_05550 [Bacillus sp. DJP31]|uniref:hypothetical protein n=1 Tax=Bacillus sp. DJP31 TaxID=3409789 RepID=UPI003BB5170E
MVTISYLLVFVVSVVMVGLGDTYLYEISFLDAILYLVVPEPSTNKSISVGANVVALMVALGIDYRVWKKNKTSPKQVEGK